MGQIQENQIVCSNFGECAEIKKSFIKNILVPYDDSDRSFHAFEFALDLAKKYHADITLLAVTNSGAISSSFLNFSDKDLQDDRKNLERLNRSFRILNNTATKLGIKIHTEIKISSNTSDTILSFIGSTKMDLVVIGSRNKSGPVYVSSDGIAVTIAQRSPVPVVVIK